MIIWRGMGFLVVVITFLALLAGELISESLTNDENYYQENKSPMVVAFFIAGIIIGLIGKGLNNKKGKVFIDKETRQEVTFKTKHELFFIPMEYWGYILVGCSILVVILK
ncbi:hypothetical protein I2I11_17165 [Pontibacter sp. 172403-2]|uniref:hypothetical protein n=1 Tax=Pontibacter rufus TaxID=2791028 RepID=UPI0018AF8D4D|nr:hypothetical protein [Pontibacter sp. 172403-2]MBF9255032.1 hypothetical protein [Pontibacter sp. 172403-2]